LLGINSDNGRKLEVKPLRFAQRDIQEVALVLREEGFAAAAPDTVTTKAAGIKLKLIPAGTFRMGSPDDDKEAGKDQKPRHQVRLSAFYLGVTEITRGQFRRFVDDTG
jgi:formylglycine-generating enzyme required for sulfatase activity